MALYRTGSVSVTNGSTTVTGSGTAWVGAINAGWGFNGPDDSIYEIASVVSATQITLATPYQGGTQSGASYSIVPTQGLEQNLVTGVNGLLTNYQGVYDGPGQGKFPDGTVAAPGVRFAADEDTGLYRPASNQLAAAVGGVQRTLLSSTAYEIDVPITGLAAQSSATDGTVGRLLKVGAFGLGGAAASIFGTDSLASRNLTTGLYQYAANNIPDAPETAAYSHALEVSYDAATNRRHYQSKRLTTAANTTKIWSGVDNGSGGIHWSPVPIGPFLVGTVAQSGGVPTGAVIERGSNANGEYVRFADGTQICGVSAQCSAAGAITKTWPSAFSATPRVALSAVSATESTNATYANNTTTSIDLHGWDASGSRYAAYVGIVAYGRWF